MQVVKENSFKKLMERIFLFQSLFISGSLCAGLSPGYGAPHHEYPEQNCTLETVTETVETCVPAFRNVCEQETVIVKKIIDVEQCYPVTKTVCTEGLEVVDNQICVYKYGPKSEETETKSVSVDYTTPCVTQIVTVCDPGYGYGDVQCKDVDQETCYNAPELSEKFDPTTVTYPEPEKVCEDKPIDLTKVTCEDITTEKCILVPQVEDVEETVEVCKVELGEPNCNEEVLELPREHCIEIVYGYALGYDKKL